MAERSDPRSSARPSLSILPLLIALLLFGPAALPCHAQRTTLADFGGSPAATQLPYGDWQQVLRNESATTFADPDGTPAHDGIRALADAPAGATAYFGVTGTTPIQMQVGHKIIATFFNPTATDQDIHARFSVTDGDAPDAADGSHPWTSMHALNGEGQRSTWITVPAGDIREAEAYITDATTITAHNAGVTAGARNLVNINLANNNTDVILTRIDLSNETDTSPPTAPSQLTATLTATSPHAGQTAVRLDWSAAADAAAGDTGLRAYLIYRDGTLYDAVTDTPERYLSYLGQSPFYRDIQVQPGRSYQYHVTAVDFAPVGAYPTRTAPSRRHGNESAASNSVTITVPAMTATGVIAPYEQLSYQGAFRLPDDGTETDWAYASRGLTFHPAGNPDRDPEAELPGSLYAVTGLPAGERIAELTIPLPVDSSDPASLNRAEYLQQPADIWPAAYDGSTTPSGGAEGKSLAIAYHPATGGVPAQIYYTVSNQYGTDDTAACLGAFDLDLTRSAGPWHIGTPPDTLPPALVSAIAFSAPGSWAAGHTDGRSLIVGNTYISGSGVPATGPSLFAVAPWESGALPAAEGSVSCVELLRYGAGADYSHWGLNFAWDEFGEGGAFLVNGNTSAVAVSKRRSIGDYWYGYASGDTLCEYNIPEADMMGHGVGATDWGAELVFYDPADPADVAGGSRESWEPMPYAAYVLSTFSLRSTGGRDAGAIAYDSAGNNLYFIEHNGDPGYEYGYSLIHVWRLTAAPAGEADSDGDGTPDSADQCPGDPDKTAPGSCGCGVPEGTCQTVETIDGGAVIVSGLWLKTVLQAPAGPVTLKWTLVGADITPSGDQVVSGYFYADPDDFAYGSPYNPEAFVKIYIASNGWANIAVNHVTVDAVTVSSAHQYAGSPDQAGSVTLDSRLAEHTYTGVAIDESLTGGTPSAGSAATGGATVSGGLWLDAVLKPVSGDVGLRWREVGSDTTPSGDQVVSGYFYADPGDFAYGSPYNPELFVKIYIASNGWANIAFNHVTVDDVSVYSAHNDAGTPAQSTTATLAVRLVEQAYTGVATR